MADIPQRPYLIRAMHAWMSDNGWTPQLLIDAEVGTPALPEGIVEDGQVLLNVSHQAVRNLVLGDEFISFEARFSGRSFQVIVPVEGVEAIFSREERHGMAFPMEDGDVGLEMDPEPPEPPVPPKPKGPTLRVVK
jgi:stringent starvation protein B